jgi:molecular chaperone GrpE
MRIVMDGMNEKLGESPEAPSPAGPEPVIEGKSDQPEEPAIDWQDRCLRLAAEFDNFRKRTAREYAQIIKNAEEQLIVELTAVLDNLERALSPEHRNANNE